MAGASVSSFTFDDILKEFYLPPVMAQLNQQSILFGTAFFKIVHKIGDVAFAERAERITLMLADLPRSRVPTDLVETGKLLGFYHGGEWRLPAEHPLAA